MKNRLVRDEVTSNVGITAPNIPSQWGRYLIFFLVIVLFAVSALPKTIVAANLPAGDLAPYGSTDGLLDINDVLILQRIVNGSLLASDIELLKGDVAPFGEPDGQLDLRDVQLLERAVHGQIVLPDIIVFTSLASLNVGPSPVASEQYILTGTASPNTQVNLYVNKVKQTNTISNSDNGEFSVNIILQEGLNLISATLQEGGVESEHSLPRYVLLDSTLSIGPSAVDRTLVSITDNGDGTITVSGEPGSVEAGMQVTIHTSGGDSVTVTSNATDGSFSAQISGNSDDGISVVVEDTEGNQSKPVGMVVVGATPGIFEVSDSGAAVYNIPLQLPSGIAGMTPTLSLNYSSQSGNGLLGVGWSIGGLSSITRCPATIAQDSTVDGVDFDSNDKFCLDGQRLVSISGNYGGDGTEYRTEIDSYSKIISYGSAGNGPSYFKVWTKSGQIKEYGNWSDAKIEAQGRSDVLVWAVNKISDTVGNYIRYTYNEENSDGYHNISTIEYSGNENTGMLPYARVIFGYEPTSRQDSTTGYIAGSKVSSYRRISQISTWVNGSIVRSYNLKYEYGQATNRSRLISLTECDAQDICKPPTKLSWQNKTVGFSGTVSSSICNNSQCDSDNKPFNYYPDVNGDGKTDLCYRSDTGIQCYLSTGTGWGYHINTTICRFPACDSDNINTIRFPDLNADGKSDLCYRDDQNGVTCYFSNGSDFVTPFYTGICPNSYCDSDNKSTISYPDINGDSLPDLCYRHDYGVRCHLGTGTGFGTLIPSSICSSGCDSDNYPTIRFPDINGDGKADVVYRDDRSGVGVRVYLSTGSSFVHAFDTGLCSNYNVSGSCKDYFYYPDINGDGNDDMCWRSNSGVRCYPSTGTGLGGLISTSYCADGTQYCNGGDNHNTIQFVDINSDGMRDLVYRSDVGVKAHLSTGTGFSSAISTGICANTTNGGDCDGDNIYTVMFPDINGDGLMDIAVRGDSGVYVVKSQGAYPDLLTGITDGLANEISIDYKSLTDDSIYVKRTASAFPERDVQAPMYVVSSFATDNGIGGTTTTNYQYDGLKMNVHGRGLLGFAKIIATDDTSGLLRTTTYSQAFPTQGMVMQVDVDQVGGSPVSLDTNKWLSIDNGDGTYNVQLDSNYKITNHLVTGNPLSTTITSYVYGPYGNVERITVDIDGGAAYGGVTKRTDNTYSSANTEKWYLDRLETSSVTSMLTLSDTATRTTSYEYDNNTGLLTAEIIEPNNADLMLRTEYSYDNYGNKTSVTVSGSINAADPIVARTSTSTYDYSNLHTNATYTTTSTNALSHTETKVIDVRLGVVDYMTGPNGLTTTWSYDGYGDKTVEYRADGTSVSVNKSWCGSGCPNSNAKYKIVTAESGQAPSTVYYDLLGREVVSEVIGINGEAISTITEYDNKGRVSRKSRPHAYSVVFWTSNEYDVLDRVILQTHPDGSQTQIIYDGFRTTTINAKNQQSIQVKNSQGNVIEVIDDDGKKNLYKYDAFDNLIEVKDPLGNTSSMSYDIRGNKISMNDPDMGAWQYRYNAVGQLVWQKDAKQQEVTMQYDVLGRMIGRTEPEGVSTWVYDDAPGKGIGKLSQVNGTGGYSREYTYNDLGRLAYTITTISGESFQMSTEYDMYGRIEASIYPDGFATRNGYASNGQLSRVENYDDSNLVYWQGTAINADGQFIQEILGNGLTRGTIYSSQTGYINGINIYNNGPYIQNLRYDFDALGNLEYRQDDVQGITETFQYDNHNRLKQASVTGGTPITYQYDEIGNITVKGTITDYAYGQNNAGPHAVTTANGQTFAYDDNGNQISGNGRSITYTSFNKPVQISKGSTSSSFTYDADRKRIKNVRNVGIDSEVTYYLGKSYEKVITPGGVIEHRHYLNTGNTTILYTTRSDSSHDTRYLHKDHLGSTDLITDENGQIVGQQSFGAWGDRRNSNWTSPAKPITSEESTRGFTGHEQEDNLGLVNMNARMYDPVLGRFLQADSFTQFPHSTQGLNRYSYVNNNPLSFTDPSGNFLLALAVYTWQGYETMALAAAADLIGAKNSSGYRQVSSFASALTGIPWITAATASMNTWGAGGSERDIIRSAAIAFGSAKAFNRAHYMRGPKSVIAHGVIGGVRSKLQGGSFETGFVSQAFSKAVSLGSEAYKENLGDIGRGIVVVVAGGMIAEFGGGKFKNGALTSTFGYMFNEMNRPKRNRKIVADGEVTIGSIGYRGAEYGIMKVSLSVDLYNDNEKLLGWYDIELTGELGGVSQNFRNIGLPGSAIKFDVILEGPEISSRSDVINAFDNQTATSNSFTAGLVYGFSVGSFTIGEYSDPSTIVPVNGIAFGYSFIGAKLKLEGIRYRPRGY